MTVIVARRVEELRQHYAPGAGRAVVMTLGALHEGHAALISAARRRLDADRPDGAAPRGQLVVTVYVNPLQFGAGEDFERYPRTLDADVALAEAAGADLVYAPDDAELYPGGPPRVRIGAGSMGELLEGASRPGHFDGVLTVVAKLLHLVGPDVACFGAKDAQQVALIRRMVADLDFPTEIVEVPTVREPDGLALSSRNRYLSAPERTTALAVSRALFAARDRLAAGGTGRADGALGPASTAGGEGPAADASSSAVAGATSGAEAAPTAAAGHDRAAGPGVGTTGRSARRPAAAAATPANDARAAAREVLDEATAFDPPLRPDYLALVDPADFTEVPADFTGVAILMVAARVGTTRLIDNIRLTLGQGGPE